MSLEKHTSNAAGHLPSTHSGSTSVHAQQSGCFHDQLDPRRTLPQSEPGPWSGSRPLYVWLTSFWGLGTLPMTADDNTSKDQELQLAPSGSEQ